MEMIGPKTYIGRFENCSIQELKDEKKRLCEKISELEVIARHPEDSPFSYYDNDAKLSVYKQYLAELVQLIKTYGENND